VIAVAEYEKTIQQAFREVADLLVARDRLAEQLAAQQANAEAQKHLLRLVEARYQAGIVRSSRGAGCRAWGLCRRAGGSTGAACVV